MRNNLKFSLRISFEKRILLRAWFWKYCLKFYECFKTSPVKKFCLLVNRNDFGKFMV